MIFDKKIIAFKLYEKLIEKPMVLLKELQRDIPDDTFKEILDFMKEQKMCDIDNEFVKRHKFNIENFVIDEIASSDKKLTVDDLDALLGKELSKKVVESLLKKKKASIDSGFIEICETVRHSQQESNETSFYIDRDKKMYEEVYDAENKEVKFACYDDSTNSISYVQEIDGKKPIYDDGVKLGAVLLPSQPEEFTDLTTLISDIKNYIHKYLDISPPFENISAYYVLLSWLYDKVNTIAYLRHLGDFATGKSRALSVTGGLCYKSCTVSGAITPAPIYRMIKRWGGTIVFEESDFRDSSEQAEIIKILNCGFEKDKPVIRCLKDNPDTIQFLPTYSPKVFSSRKTFYDKALESRCLTEIMLETSRDDISSILPPAFYEERQHLINKLLMFRFKYYNKVDPNIIQNVDLGHIEKRLKQATLNFAILFSNMPELMADFKSFLKDYNETLVDERYSTVEGMIIESIFKLNSEGVEYISSKDIALKMETEYELKKPLDARTVGKYLKSLGMKTKETRTDGQTRRTIQWDERLMNLLKTKYIPTTQIMNETIETLETGHKMNENLVITTHKIDGSE